MVKNINLLWLGIGMLQGVSADIIVKAIIGKPLNATWLAIASAASLVVLWIGFYKVYGKRLIK